MLGKLSHHRKFTLFYKGMAKNIDFQGPGHCNPEYRIDTGSTSKCNNRIAMRAPTTHVTEERVVNRRKYIYKYI